MPVSVIFGLGNPGKEYERTRHNIGFALLDVLAQRAAASWTPVKEWEALRCTVSLCGREIVLVKPTTFMNLSGRTVQHVCRSLRIKPNYCLVVYDDIHLNLGSQKLTIKGGDGGHNGIKDIHERLGDSYIRLRLGVGPKSPPEMDLKDFVLGRFAEDEEAMIEQEMNHWIEGIEWVVRKGPNWAMNFINKKKQP